MKPTTRYFILYYALDQIAYGLECGNAPDPGAVYRAIAREALKAFKSPKRSSKIVKALEEAIEHSQGKKKLRTTVMTRKRRMKCGHDYDSNTDGGNRPCFSCLMPDSPHAEKPK